MRSALVSSVTDSLQGNDFLAVAVSVAGAPFTLPPAPVTGEDQAQSENVSEAAVNAVADVTKSTKSTASTEAESDVAEAADADDAISGEAGLFDFSKMHLQLGATFEACGRTLSDLNKKYSQPVSLKETLDGMDESVKNVRDETIDAEWVNKAKDVNVNTLMRLSSESAQASSEGEKQEGGVTAEALKAAGIDEEVHKGFTEYVSALIEKYSKHFEAFRNVRKQEVMKSVEGMSADAQVDNLAERIATSDTMEYGHRMMGSVADQYRIIGSLMGFRNNMGNDDGNNDGEVEDKSETNGEESHSH